MSRVVSEFDVYGNRMPRHARATTLPGARVRAVAAGITLAALACTGLAHAATHAAANGAGASATASPAATAGAATPAPATVATPPAGAATAALKPHAITFRTTFKGMNAGDLELKLTRDNGTWTYETRANPSFLARFAVNPASRERGEFRVGPKGVQPLRYSLDDGTKDTGKDARLEYDWTRGRVTGSARSESIDLPVEPGTQDPLSIRAAVLVDLTAGREPGEYRMLDGHEFKTYVYRREGTQRLKTALGEVETVVYTSKRKDADARARSWKYWYAPSQGWLPVRIEQIDKGEPRIVFVVRSVQWL